MDPEVQLAIKEGNEEVAQFVAAAFKESLREAVQNIIKHIDAKTTPIERDIKRLRENDRDHYDSIGALKERAGKHEGDQKEIIQKIFGKIEGNEKEIKDVKDIIDTHTSDNRFKITTWIAVVAVLIAAIAVIVVLV